MEFSLLALIGISLATMFFGYFFGLIEGRGQGYKRGRKEESLSRAQEPSPPATPAQRPESATDEQRSLLVVRRDEAGQPSVQVDGQLVAASNVSPALRRRMIDLMVMLRPWIEPPGAAAQAEAGSAPRNAPAAPQTRMPIPATTGAVAEPTASLPAVSAAGPGPQAMSLVQQIDHVLQARLAGTPLASRGIRLAEAPHGGAIVFIGQIKYDGVDKVADPEIQGAIRSAIAEWEKRYTPG
jgi:hypothetical protein